MSKLINGDCLHHMTSFCFCLQRATGFTTDPEDTSTFLSADTPGDTLPSAAEGDASGKVVLALSLKGMDHSGRVQKYGLADQPVTYIGGFLRQIMH